MRKFLTYLFLILLCACGRRGGKAVSHEPATREFPQVTVPAMYTDPAERAAFATTHFWDRFTDTTKAYACDSVTVNGVPMAAVESQMGLFASLLGQMPLDEGGKAVARLYDQAEADRKSVV